MNGQVIRVQPQCGEIHAIESEPGSTLFGKRAESGLEVNRELSQSLLGGKSDGRGGAEKAFQVDG